MARAFLVVMDSVGIGGAPDAHAYFNGKHPDTGANTLAHIAEACDDGRADTGRSGPLHLPTLASLGLGAAVRLASDGFAPGLEGTPTGLWGGRRLPTPKGGRGRGLAVCGPAWGKGMGGLRSFPKNVLGPFFAAGVNGE